MFLERLLFLFTGVVVFVCLGFALMMIASAPEKRARDAAATSSPVIAAKPQKSAAAPPMAPFPPPPASAPKTPEQEFERLISGTPDYGRFFKRLHEAFPADYTATVESFKARAARGGADQSADFYVSEAVRLLRQARGVLAAKADGAQLEKVFDVQLKILRAIANENPAMCVTFLYGGADQDFMQFAANRRPLVGEMALAGLEAIASGQSRKIERAAPSDADFRTLEAALAAKGLGRVEIDALLDGKMPDPPLEPARMCAAGQTYLETLHSLPESVRMRIYGLAVELMARS